MALIKIAKELTASEAVPVSATAPTNTTKELTASVAVAVSLTDELNELPARDANGVSAKEDMPNTFIQPSSMYTLH